MRTRGDAEVVSLTYRHVSFVDVRTVESLPAQRKHDELFGSALATTFSWRLCSMGQLLWMPRFY